MSRLKASNNATTALTNAIDNVQTSFIVDNVSLFPVPPFRISIDAEIMEVTSVDAGTNTFTVKRGMEGTTSVSHAAAAKVDNRLTAGSYEELLAKEENVIVSETEPTMNLYDGLMWYKSSTDETRIYFKGFFRDMGVYDNSVDTAAIQDGAVTTIKLAGGSVTSAKIQDGTIKLVDVNTTDFDTRYYTETELDGGQLDTRYYTETEVDTLLSNSAAGESVSFRKGDTLPTTASEGDVFYHTVEDQTYYYNGTSWQPFSSGPVDSQYIKTFKNTVYNSSFELFDKGTLRPTYWDGGTVSNASNFDDTYSVVIPAGITISQHDTTAEDNYYVKPQDWSNHNARISLYYKYAPVTVHVYAVDGTGTETLLASKAFATPSNWERVDFAVDVTGYEAQGLKLKFENTGTVDLFVDAVQMEPDFNGKWASFYTDGPNSIPMDANKIQGIPVNELNPTSAEDGYVLTYDHTTGKIILKAKAKEGGGATFYTTSIM